MSDKLFGVGMFLALLVLVSALPTVIWLDVYGPCAETVAERGCRNRHHRVEVVSGIALCRCQGSTRP